MSRYGRRKLDNIDESGDDRSYYHGRISRDAAVDALTDRGVDGSFLLRMSESQDGVYTISVMQGSAVRHIRVINTDGGYALSHGDPPEESVWSLIESQMHKSLTNTVDASDAVSLRYPLPAAQEAIAPDLLNTAGEAGMDASEFDDDVAAFLEGAASAKEIVRQRSVKHSIGKPKEDLVREVLAEDMASDPDLERFMNGAISANELHRRRSVKGGLGGGGGSKASIDNPFGDGFDPDNC